MDLIVFSQDRKRKIHKLYYVVLKPKTIPNNSNYSSLKTNIFKK